MRSLVSGLVSQRRIVCLLWLCLALSGCLREPPSAGTVATVNGQPISLRLLNAVQSLSYFQRGGSSSDLSVDTLRRQYGIALASLIAHSLVVQELRQKGLDVPPDRMREEEARIRADYLGGEFEQSLLETQMDIQTWRELLHNQLALRIFAEKELFGEVDLSPQEIEAQYARQEEEFSWPPLLHLRTLSGTDPAQLESACAALRDNPAAVLPPGVLEQKTAMPKTSVPEEWRKDVDALKPGGVSPVRKGQFLYQAVQLLEEMPAKRMNLLEAYPLVERALLEEKIDARYAAWLEQAVQKADIRVSVHLRDGFVAKGTAD